MVTTREDREFELAFTLFKGLVKLGVDPKSEALKEVINDFMQRVDQITTKETK